ncbi:MAG TPA: nuclear transport factor 2 family protein, partial [Chloroflexia bacterium]
NEEIGEAERNKEGERIGDHLSDDLIFLRASGKVDNKPGYLASLKVEANTNDYLAWDIRQITVRGHLALAVVDVTLRGKRGGNAVDGVFRNFRTFRKRGGRWKLVTWANMQVLNNIQATPPPPPPPPAS